MASLVEIDSLDIQVIIDNELDPISPPTPDTVQVTGGLMGQIALFTAPALQPGERGGAVKELRMDDLCCSAHGLSIMVTATRGDVKRTVLFDTGPEEDVWERNVKRLRADVSKIDLIVLSHWHRDHSGGMLKAIKTINKAKQDKSEQGGQVTVDLHPSRPDYRGFLMGDKIVSLEADPSFEEITENGATLSLNSETHSVLEDMFLISGEIPRETSYEHGVKFGMRFDKSDNDWFSDEKIADERFLMCNLKGKGIVLFTGCSHAGVVNTSRHALKQLDSVPLHAVVGGYHLATTHDAKQIEPTVKDLKTLNPDVLMPGHCTGWRAKFAIEQQMPGRLVPCTVGTKLPAMALRPLSAPGHAPSLWRFSRSPPRQPAFSQFRQRRFVHPNEFRPFVPPSPSSLGKATHAKTYTRTRKWLRRLFYISLTAGTIFVIDRQFYASALTRTTRTFALGLVVALDYKINFRPDPPFASSIAAVHQRNAERLSDLLRHNGGLYLKIGQAIAMQSAILPPEFQKMFSRMFDDAPQNDWKDVEKVIKEDFGKSVEEVFGVSFTGDPTKGVMERRARASASVAQVHWARLADGREVAIKIQKREIAAQVEWDLWAFKIVSYIYSRWFDIPFYNLVPFVSERLFLETDFENEARNGEKMAEFVANEPRLRNRVYIPKVYHDLSSKRVMTAEWIEGVRLWDKEAITRSWKGGWREGSPGSHGTPLDPPNKQIGSREELARKSVASLKIKPERTHWKGWKERGGLGLSLKEVMTTMVDLFSAQMFLWGWVHCDPHPGNIFVRRQPNGQPEIVLIDHGLYIQMTPKFRHQYATFWKALLTLDNKTMKEIVGQWGVNNPDIFASATLMRPYRGGDLSTHKGIQRLSKEERQNRSYEMQQAARKAIRDILGDETKWPRELIFIGRNLRIVQGNNQFLGSPVNRVKITATWASRALAESPDMPLSQRIRNYGGHIIFRLVLFTSDVVFYFTKIRQVLGWGGGMEDDIEKQMKVMAKDMGVELDQDLFEG